MSNVVITFKGKAVEIDGIRHVKLVEPSGQHVSGNLHPYTMRQVVQAWKALFGHNGWVPENSSLVEQFGEGFMPTVEVNIGNPSQVAKFYRLTFPELVDKFRSEGLGLIASEDKAHELLEAYALSSRR